MSNTNELTPFIPTPDEAESQDLRQALLLRSFTDQLFGLILAGRFNSRARITVSIPRDTLLVTIAAVKAILVDRKWDVQMGEVGIDMRRTTAFIVTRPVAAPATPPTPVAPPAPVVIPPTKLHPADDMEGGACVMPSSFGSDDAGGATSTGGAASLGGIQRLS
jgi:hypothetical protein